MRTWCEVPECRSAAEIVIGDPAGDELLVCHEHWTDALRRSGGLIRGVRFVREYGVEDAQTCFRPACDHVAIKIIRNIDGTRRPVCKQHWDDLSWVDIDQEALFPDTPGWSHA